MTRDEFLAESFRRFEAEVSAYQALREEEMFLRGRVRALKIMTNALRRALPPHLDAIGEAHE